MDIYVDGSWSANNPKLVGWAFVIIGTGKQIIKKGKLTGKITDMHQVGGEIKAVIEAVVFCNKEGLTIETIYYDYDGIKKWANAEWKAKNIYTQAYKKFLEDKKISASVFVKTDSYNNYADEYARQITGAKGRH